MKTYLLLLLTGTMLLSGCTSMLVGGAVGVGMMATDRRTLGTIVEDQTIEAKLLQKFYDSPSLRDKAHIQVTSYNKSVLLTGEAPAMEDILLATQLAQNINQVQKVFNEVKVQTPSSIADRSADALITTKVKARLFNIHIKDFYPTRIKVATANRTVFLMGLVTPQEAHEVVEQVRRVKGVKLVVKFFEIKHYDPQS